MSKVLGVLDGLFKVLLSGNTKKKDIRFLERKLKKYKRKWAKDGLTDDEETKIKELELLIHEKIMNL